MASVSASRPPSAPRPAPTLSRRLVLGGGLAGGALVATAASPLLTARPALADVLPQLAPVFTLGVASGDPTSDGVVLWTRLAVDPVAGDGLGGMPAVDVPVRWELSRTPTFSRVERRGEALATAASAHSVHVEVDGLAPARPYWYRFRVQDQLSPVGRTTTSPTASSTAALTVAVASCARYEDGFFTAYRHLVDDHPDLVLHLGDYLYEYGEDTDGVRRNLGPETTTLAGYRQRHAQYKTDPDLQLAHAAAPWVVVWDDHELDNNWADEVPEQAETGFLERRTAAFRAYYENMPLRRSSVPAGVDLQLFRRVEWGRTATLHVMDTRQYRSDQACGDGTAIDCGEALDPSRTITGDTQEAWLLDGAAASSATWQVLGQQVFFSQRDFTAGAVQAFSMDGWDGYTASRARILDGFAERGVTDPVVLTGDVHRHYACDVRRDFDDPASPVVATELVTTSVTTGGDGSDTTAATDVQLAENPHIRLANTQRGYVLARFSEQELRADFRVVPYVTRPGAPASTRASFVVEAGTPGLQPV